MILASIWKADKIRLSKSRDRPGRFQTYTKRNGPRPSRVLLTCQGAYSRVSHFTLNAHDILSMSESPSSMPALGLFFAL